MTWSADSAPISKVIRTTRLDNLDLVPSTLAVAKLDMELVTMHRREEQLAMALQPVYEDYDAIVLDLSPNLGQLVITALNAARLVHRADRRQQVGQARGQHVPGMVGHLAPASGVVGAPSSVSC